VADHLRIDVDAIVVVEVFSKKTQKTPSLVIDQCQKRLRNYDELAQRSRAMDRQKKKRLESAGWKVGDASEFLGLTDEEAAIVEHKVALAGAVREQRSRRSLTQDQLGRLLGSSQSRVA
jgi:hypothetical protein